MLTAVHNGIVVFGDGNDPCFQRDLFAFKPLGVTGTIPSLVVAEYPFGEIQCLIEEVQDAVTDNWVLSHFLLFLFAQPPGLIQQLPIQYYLADIVQMSRIAQFSHFLLRHIHRASDLLTE